MKHLKGTVMKTMVQSVAIILVLLMVSASVSAQVTTPSAADKQKQEELAKQKEAEAQKKKQEELTKLREYELQKKMQEAEQEMARHERGPEYEEALHDYDAIRMRAEEMSKDYQTDIRLKVMPEDKMFMYAVPHLEDFYLYDDMGHVDKPGSSWNYTRQVLEATFTNEFTMDAGGDDGNVNLSVSGNCAEGSISVAIIMPDGKQLSEVLIDENGSLNWRKSLEENEESKWKNGKWIFKIKAKNATGNFRISMNSN
jgi:nitrate reductase cytochrome c-type subunit